MTKKAKNKAQMGAAVWFVVWLSKLSSILATIIVRKIIIVIFLIILIYVLYLRAWQPLVEAVPLPPGIAPTNPELNSSLLRDINDQRVERGKAKTVILKVDQFFKPERLQTKDSL